METEYRFRPIAYRAESNRVAGVAVAYGSEAKLPGFRETFAVGAFGDVKNLDVLANIQHRRDRPIARTGGGGLELTDSAEALRAEIDLPNTADGRDAAELLWRGVLRGFSVEFAVNEERFERGVRIVEKATLRGLALVDRPAYPDSLAAIAERMQQIEQAERLAAEPERRIWFF